MINENKSSACQLIQEEGKCGAKCPDRAANRCKIPAEVLDAEKTFTEASQSTEDYIRGNVPEEVADKIINKINGDLLPAHEELVEIQFSVLAKGGRIR
jgi:hypothetical protein